jgi:hypothetical protein
LRRTANTHPDRLDPTRLQKRAHLSTESAVTIKDGVSVWAWQRKRFSELLQDPLACRVRGRIEVKNAAPMVLDDEEGVQHPETQRGYGKEVEGGHHLAVILEECQPALHLGLIRTQRPPRLKLLILWADPFLMTDTGCCPLGLVV